MIRVNFLMTFRLMTASQNYKLFAFSTPKNFTIQFFPSFFFTPVDSEVPLNLMLYLIFVIVENNVIHNRVTYNIKETSTIVKQLHHNKNSELQLLQPLIILRGIYIPPSVFSTKKIIKQNHKSH